jgi:hypothetical protein
MDFNAKIRQERDKLLDQCFGVSFMVEKGLGMQRAHYYIKEDTGEIYNLDGEYPSQEEWLEVKEIVEKIAKKFFVIG